MTRPRLWGALAIVWLVAASASAAPVPEGGPSGQGAISDYLLRRDSLPAVEAPLPAKVVARDNTLEVVDLSFEYRMAVREQSMKVQETVPIHDVRERVVRRDGREVTEKFTIVVHQVRERERIVQVPFMMAVPVLRKRTANLTDCRFFTVTRAGKLEPIEAGLAVKRLAEPTAVLTGSQPEIDPRHLELVKPGTLYLVRPTAPAGPIAPGPVPFPEGKGRE